MVSSAFSRKKFDTKAPAICKPPPWPPFIPPPPLPETIFYCFATFKHDPWGSVPNFAANCSLYFNPAWGYWIGTSKKSDTAPWIAATIRSSLSLPSYYIRITFHWPPTGATSFEWAAQLFTSPRPYVGETLTKFAAYYNQRATVNAREKPN